MDPIRKNAYIVDQKTQKQNTLYLKPVKDDLEKYYQWLQDKNIDSGWLFPSTTHHDRHITEKQFYKIMHKTGDLLGIDYLGTHTMRKTGAYRVYVQTNYNIGLVLQLLNHSSKQ
jgi:integrase